MTSEPPSPATAVFLLADHQAGVPEGVIKAPPRVGVEADALALARAKEGLRPRRDVGFPQSHLTRTLRGVMSRVILYMAMSLDGFITGPGDGKENPAGVGGMRLMEWLGGGGSEVSAWRPSDSQSQIVFDEMMSTGAVITGRRTGEFADYWGGDHHGGVPIFVPAHTAPADNRHERVHFVTEGILACAEQAKTAAGDRDVLLHGAYTAQECLKAGVLDVLEIQLMPVLLGQGRLLFEGLPANHIELDLVRALEAPKVLHLRYEVRR